MLWEVWVSSFELNICQAVFLLGLNNVLNGFVLHWGESFFMLSLWEALLLEERRREKVRERMLSTCDSHFPASVESQMRNLTELCPKIALRILKQMSFTPQPPSSTLHRGEIGETAREWYKPSYRDFQSSSTNCRSYKN